MEAAPRAGAAPSAAPHVAPTPVKPDHEQRLPFTYADDDPQPVPANTTAPDPRAAAALHSALTRHAPTAGSPPRVAAAAATPATPCDGASPAFEFDIVAEHLIPQHAAGAHASRTCGSVASAASAGPGGTARLSAAALRARIRAIGVDPALSSADRDRARQQLYSNAYSVQQRAASQAYRARMDECKFDRSWSEHVDPNTGTILPGCQHYARNCKIQAPCCGMWVVCRHCHDVPAMTAEHEIDRFAVERVLCMSCWTEQNVGERCMNAACGERFARYFCAKCKFYDDTPDKEIYHCDKCAICRVGRDNHHCDKCNACVSLGDGEEGGHHCLKSSLDANCPICSGYMLTSTAQVVFLQCGHAMHMTCFDKYTSLNYVCPICSKSLTDMSPYYEQIDEVVAEQQLPDIYERRKVEVLCHDCDVRCVTAFHFLYHKCVQCNGYNTRLIADCDDDEQIRVLPGRGVPPSVPTASEDKRRGGD